MEKDESFKCEVCYKLPKDAVQWNYTVWSVWPQSRGLQAKSKKNAKCPYCRKQPFETFESPLRSKINNTKIRCTYCKKDYTFVQIQKHEHACEDQIIQCKLCLKNIKRKDIVTHTKDVHTNNVPSILKSFHQSLVPIPNPQEVINKFVKSKKDYGSVPHLGMTGKFYCGEKLGLLCNCCNGFCGPTNGQNCIKCMKLDMIRKGLSRGFLVNGVGSVCWKDSKGHFFCGLMYYAPDVKTCGEGTYCKFCRNTTISQQRYKNLLQKE